MNALKNTQNVLQSVGNTVEKLLGSNPVVRCLVEGAASMNRHTVMELYGDQK